MTKKQIKENKMNKIDFVTANDGKIQFHLSDGEVVASSNAVTLAKFINNYGFDDDCYCGSSMDFSDCYGFKNCNAHEILQKAKDISNIIWVLRK
jgi:hypothetical protein